MTYRLSKIDLLRILWYLLWGRLRPIAPEAERALAKIDPPPLVEGEAHIPATGPLVVVANHYERPGFWVVWGGMLITRTLCQRRPHSPLHWVITNEWQGHRLGPLPIPVAFTRWFLSRVARIMDAIEMPAENEPRRRLGAIRTIASMLAGSGQGQTVALFPEGPVTESRLVAMKGAGSLLAYLSYRGATVLPVGLFERDGALVARFGPPVAFDLPSRLAKNEQDAVAGRQIMESVSRLITGSKAGVAIKPPPGAVREAGL